jgi:prevent-host-death family protein
MAAAKPDRDGTVITRVALSEARAKLGAVVRRVHDEKEYVVLERDGEPVAALVDIDEFEDLLELRDPEVQRLIHESREDELAGRIGPARKLLEELIAEEKEQAPESDRSA